MGFGGPHAGYLAVRKGLERQLPAGSSASARTRRATPRTASLQAREQHIRREKATSNICTAQVLLAVMAAMYAVYHGPDGLARIAERVHSQAALLARLLTDAGLTLRHDDFFDTVAVVVPGGAEAAVTRARDAGFDVRLVDSDTVAVSVDETVTSQEVIAVAIAIGDLDSSSGFIAGAARRIPAVLERATPFLVHPVFNTHRSETSMMRYLKRLADADYALDRGMIPLGSCTMKLNAATEMEAVSWPEFANLHPFAPSPTSRAPSLSSTSSSAGSRT